ncbi:MAG: hypothetical protein AAFV32_03415 [Myxococcota bacterium]
MRKTLKNLWAPIVLVSAGCGDLTNEDLVFLAAIPQSEELAIKVSDSAGTPSANVVQNAVVGESSTLFRTLESSADELNGNIDFILEFVNDLGRDVSPTRREDDRRIWGPYEADDNEIAIRLEIARDSSSDRPVYTFCLHGALRGQATGDPVCSVEREATDRSNGWRAVLYGRYSPLNVREGARSGSGTITLDFDASRAVGLDENPEDEGRVSFDYDFSAGGVSKALDVRLTNREVALTRKEYFVWNYRLSADGEVIFNIEFDGNADGTDPDVLEFVSVDACWGLTGPGRASFSTQAGDLGDASTAGSECWSAQQVTVFEQFQTVDGDMFSLGDEGGCREACPSLE